MQRASQSCVAYGSTGSRARCSSTAGEHLPSTVAGNTAGGSTPVSWCGTRASGAAATVAAAFCCSAMVRAGEVLCSSRCSCWFTCCSCWFICCSCWFICCSCARICCGTLGGAPGPEVCSKHHVSNWVVPSDSWEAGLAFPAQWRTRGCVQGQDAAHVVHSLPHLLFRGTARVCRCAAEGAVSSEQGRTGCGTTGGGGVLCTS